MACIYYTRKTEPSARLLLFRPRVGLSVSGTVDPNSFFADPDPAALSMRFRFNKNCRVIS